MTDRSTTEEEDIALAWAIRSLRPDFNDWDRLLAWLAGDPDRNRAYDRAMVAVAELHATDADEVVVPFAPRPAPARQSHARNWLAATVGIALAAGVAGIVVVRHAPQERHWQAIEAPPHRPRSLARADGSRIDLSGGSRLRIDAARPRLVILDRGRAVFTVRHDERSPYVVVAGKHRIVDVGTTFEVVQERGATRIGVNEGEVRIESSGTSVSLAEGQLASLTEGRLPEIVRMPATTIGRWRNDRMSYDHAPLPVVAHDLSLALGQTIVVDGSAADRHFSGTLTPASLRGKPAEVAAMLGVRVATERGGWRLHSP